MDSGPHQKKEKKKKKENINIYSGKVWFNYKYVGQRNLIIW